MRRHATPLAILALVAPAVAQEPTPAPKAAEPDTRACQPIFDGKTLKGWVEKGGRYDGKAEWSVEDGAIVGRQGERQAGGLLYTEERFASYLLTLETKIDWPFDSGVFLHMLPPASGLKGLQLTLDYRPDGEIGGIYADGWLQHNPAGMARFAKDAWNRVVVRCTGRRPRLEAWLNGEPLADFRLPKDLTGFAHEGRIGVQVHGDRPDPRTHAARFRAVALLELPIFEPDEFDCDDRGVLRAKPDSGWEPIFDGTSLAGWQPVGDAEGYAARDGAMVIARAPGDGYLRWRDELGDFALRFEARTAPGACCYLVLRGGHAGNASAAWCSGDRVPVLDEEGWQKAIAAQLEAWQLIGEVAGAMVPAIKDAARRADRWSTYEIEYRGRRLRVTVNGHAVCDVEPAKLKVGPTPGGPPRQGILALLRPRPAADHRAGQADAWLRNLFVKRL